jgi:hypothetical protein
MQAPALSSLLTMLHRAARPRAAANTRAALALLVHRRANYVPGNGCATGSGKRVSRERAVDGCTLARRSPAAEWRKSRLRLHVRPWAGTGSRSGPCKNVQGCAVSDSGVPGPKARPSAIRGWSSLPYGP